MLLNISFSLVNSLKWNKIWNMSDAEFLGTTFYRNFLSETKICLINKTCCRKSKSFSNMFVGNKNGFGRKSKFLSKIEIFIENRNFYRNSKFLSKLEIFIENRNFYRKSNFLSKIEIFIENRNFCRKYCESIIHLISIWSNCGRFFIGPNYLIKFYSGYFAEFF